MGFNWSKVDDSYSNNMSHPLNVKGTEESQVAPDSTTNDRLMFYEGEDVLLHDEDGLWYFGTVSKVCPSEERCLIQFDNDIEKWATFRSLRKIKSQDELIVSCIVCKSTHSSQGNLILPCYLCRRGYHQNCHKPVLPHQFASELTEWVCSRCVEERHMKEKENEVNTKTEAPLKPRNNNNKRSQHSAFPYDLLNLRWNGNHTANDENIYCYCGKSGEWHNKMLQCYSCRQWFHDNCISILKTPLLAGDRFFLFMCSVCNDGCEEKIFRLSEELTLPDMAHIALYNLTLETKKKYQDLDRSVLPFLREHWNYFKPSGDIASMSTAELRNKLIEIFLHSKNESRFMGGREFKKKDSMWGLRSCLPPPFPSALSKKALNALKEWNCAHQDVNHSTPNGEKAAKPKRKKLSTGGDEDGSKEHAAKERSRTSDHDAQRTLRARQQRVASEESVCEESSDDKLHASFLSKASKKRKRVSEEILSGPTLTSAETSGDETMGTLDFFIPAPSNFDGANNPFCDLNPGQNFPGNPACFVVRSIKKRLSEKDIRITKNGEVKRKRFVRKWKRGSPLDVANSLFRSESFPSANPHGSHLNNPKESVMNYFGAAERLAKGDKYAVFARRILPSGHSQFLIQWEADVVTQSCVTND